MKRPLGKIVAMALFGFALLTASLHTQATFVYANNEVPGLNLLLAIGGAHEQQNVEQPAPQQNSPAGVNSAPLAGKALVYVYRQGRVVGAAGFDRLFVNNEYLAALHNSNYAQREVPPGTVVFTALSRLKEVPGAILEAELLKLQKKAKERHIAVAIVVARKKPFRAVIAKDVIRLVTSAWCLDEGLTRNYSEPKVRFWDFAVPATRPILLD